MNEYKSIIDAERKIPHFQKTIVEMQNAPLVYQYRNFQSFWQILKSDSFWATNARFSNDDAEQQFGLDVIFSLSEGGVKTTLISDVGLDENYIVCFCLEDDKLSQWRGYAPDGGVSMGFDFGMPRAFSILDSSDIESTVQYVALDAVRYIDSKSKMQNEEEYSKYCKQKIELVNHINTESEKKIYCEEIQKKAPYIKHSGFVEESECRLVFHNENGCLDDCIRYRDSASADLRYPYIVVKSALPKDKTPPCVVRVCIDTNLEEALTHELETALKTTHPALVQGCHLKKNEKPDSGEPFCTGCVLRHGENVYNYHRCRYQYPTQSVEYQYFLNENANQVIISQGDEQKEIFEIVHKLVHEFNLKNNTNIRVWCEGHLPLRTITVGPCPNQANIVEAIRHYCKHTYWLRDVEIFTSTIPFRKSI